MGTQNHCTPSILILPGMKQLHHIKDEAAAPILGTKTIINKVPSILGRKTIIKEAPGWQDHTVIENAKNVINAFMKMLFIQKSTFMKMVLSTLTQSQKT